jgi:hypothetical protein
VAEGPPRAARRSVCSRADTFVHSPTHCAILRMRPQHMFGRVALRVERRNRVATRHTAAKPATYPSNQEGSGRGTSRQVVGLDRTQSSDAAVCLAHVPASESRQGAHG